MENDGGTKEAVVEPSGCVSGKDFATRNPCPLQVVTVTENGVGKRTASSAWRVQQRGGKGIIGIKLTSDAGKVVDAVECYVTDTLMISTSDGLSIVIKVSDIRVTGRASSGVRLIRLLDGDKVVSLICFSFPV